LVKAAHLARRARPPCRAGCAGRTACRHRRGGCRSAIAATCCSVWPTPAGNTVQPRRARRFHHRAGRREVVREGVVHQVAGCGTPPQQRARQAPVVGPCAFRFVDRPGRGEHPPAACPPAHRGKPAEGALPPSAIRAVPTCVSPAAWPARRRTGDRIAGRRPSRVSAKGGLLAWQSARQHRQRRSASAARARSSHLDSSGVNGRSTRLKGDRGSRACAVCILLQAARCNCHRVISRPIQASQRLRRR
jgi:hypothetical protein